MAWTAGLGLSIGLSFHAFAQQPENEPTGSDTPAQLSDAPPLDLMTHSALRPILPNVPIRADLRLTGARVSNWIAQGVRHLLIERDVSVTIGAYGFKCDRLIAMIRPVSTGSPTSYQLAIYMDNVSEMMGQGPVTQSAPRLLVTVMIEGKVLLDTNLLRNQTVEHDPLVQSAKARLKRYEQAQAERRIHVPMGAVLDTPRAAALREATRKRLGVSDLVPRGFEISPEGVAKRVDVSREKFEDPLARELTGRVAFHADKVIVKAEPSKEIYVSLMGAIQVLYNDPERGRQLTLTADNAVVMVAPEALEGLGSRQVDAKMIRGVYLEDNVSVTDGKYTMRGPRVFVDLATGRAIVLQAVFFTWDTDQQAPIYVRADRLRQASENEWSASNARLTNSEFYEPHFSIGADQLTVTREVQPDGPDRFRFNADGVGLQVGGADVFWWPQIAGTGSLAAVPLRRISGGASERHGFVARTEWDLFALLGGPAPKGVDVGLLIDGYTKRGPGIGLEADYDVPDAFGTFDGYYLFDQGEDEPGGREEVTPDNEHRGRALWRHRQVLDENWSATVQFGWISDPTFLEEFIKDEAYTEQPYETSLYLKHQHEDAAFSFLAKYDLLDFVPQWPSLQTAGNVAPAGTASVGYDVEKLPEIEYRVIARPLLEDRLTWYSEYRASNMRLSFPRQRASELGVNAADSTALFGLAAGDRFDSTLRAQGFDQESRVRLDTRQELQMPFELGIFKVAPYVVGRATWYSDDFREYSGEDENTRLWGSAGMRISTTFSRTYDDVDDLLFDVHRLRHIIEPNVQLLVAGTNLQQAELPVYDYDVESLHSGSMVRLGLRNVLETQRGGEGHWRSVEFFRLDTDFIIASDDSDLESPIARFFDYRPELSMAGDHFWSEAAWQVTDTMSLVSNVNYSFDSNRVEQWNAGFTMQHNPRLSSFFQVRDIREIDSFIFRYGFDYLMTPKYHIGYSQAFDIEESRSRNLAVTVTRRLPRWLLIFTVNFDTVGEETSVGVALAPEGAGGRAAPERNPFLYRP